MQCTRCNSDNLQTLQVIYEHGTQQIKTKGRTHGSAVGFGSGGMGVGFGSATTNTTGTSQSLMAKKAAPPAKKQIGLPIVLIIIGLFAIIGGSGPFPTVGFVLLGIGGFLFWKYSQYNKQTYPSLLSEWQNSWLCNKCGNIFTQ